MNDGRLRIIGVRVVQILMAQLPWLCRASGRGIGPVANFDFIIYVKRVWGVMSKHFRPSIKTIRKYPGRM